MAKESRLEALRQSDRLFRLLVQGLTDHAIFMLDSDGHIRNWNSGAQHIKGYTAEEIIGQHFSRFYTAEDLETDEPRRALETALRTGRYEKEGWRVRKDESRFWASVVMEPIRDDAGAHIGFAKVIRDITERKDAEARIDYLAQHDALTGLPNRVLLADRLSHAIRYAARKGGSLAVLALDLDRFTIVNDTFGHALGRPADRNGRWPAAECHPSDRYRCARRRRRVCDRSSRRQGTERCTPVSTAADRGSIPTIRPRRPRGCGQR
jgi:PAS domain S-box-containing protein